MLLRWRLALVVGAGSGLGREVALRLGRVGAGVLVVDLDRAAAERTSALVRERRVHSWAWQADLDDADDLRLVAARARDLGGADLLVNPVGAWADLTAGFLGDLDRRGTRCDEPGAVVNVVPDASLLPRTDTTETRARVTGLVRTGNVVGGARSGAPAAVLELLARGTHGTVLDLP